MDIKILVGNNNIAKFSHIIAGNLYYTIQTVEGTYQFPIKTITKMDGALFKLDAGHTQTSPAVSMSYAHISKDLFFLSEDTGTTTFNAEHKALELMRYIRIAMKTDELIKIG